MKQELETYLLGNSHQLIRVEFPEEFMFSCSSALVLLISPSSTVYGPSFRDRNWSRAVIAAIPEAEYLPRDHLLWKVSIECMRQRDALIRREADEQALSIDDDQADSYRQLVADSLSKYDVTPEDVQSFTRLGRTVFAREPSAKVDIMCRWGSSGVYARDVLAQRLSSQEVTRDSIPLYVRKQPSVLWRELVLWKIREGIPVEEAPRLYIDPHDSALYANRQLVADKEIFHALWPLRICPS